MDDAPPTARSGLAFHGPLGEARAGALVAHLASLLASAARPTALDIGCGRGELLLRLLAAAPRATGSGVDSAGDEVARARESARARGLAGRAAFHEESGHGTARGPATVVLCVGSGHAVTPAQPPGQSRAALAALRPLVEPGGRVVLGEGFWERTPTPAELARLWPGARVDDHLGLADLVDVAIAEGFRPERVETASRDEWEAFESAYAGPREAWLAAHPSDPRAAPLRAELDRHRDAWLRGYRDVLGLAYLTLIPVG